MIESVKKWTKEIIEEIGMKKAQNRFDMSSKEFDAWFNGDTDYDCQMLDAYFRDNTPFIHSMETVTQRALKSVMEDVKDEPGVYNLLSTEGSGISDNLYFFGDWYTDIHYTAVTEDKKSKKIIVIDGFLEDSRIDQKEIERLGKEKPVFVVTEEELVWADAVACIPGITPTEVSSGLRSIFDKEVISDALLRRMTLCVGSSYDLLESIITNIKKQVLNKKPITIDTLFQSCGLNENKSSWL